MALEGRALGSGPGTLWRPTPLNRGDLVFAVVVLGTVAVTLWVSHQLGTLRGPSVLQPSKSG